MTVLNMMKGGVNAEKEFGSEPEPPKMQAKLFAAHHKGNRCTRLKEAATNAKQVRTSSHVGPDR